MANNSFFSLDQNIKYMHGVGEIMHARQLGDILYTIQFQP